MADETLEATRRARGVPAYRFRSRLDGTFYGFRMTFNSRYARWFVDIEDASGTVIVAGIRVCTGMNLLAPYGDDRLPPGQLFVLDTEGLDREPSFESLADTHEMVYRPVDDVAGYEGTTLEVV